MTLLEAVIAFVLLSVVGIVCLDQSRGASQLQRTSAEWNDAIARGDAALAEATAPATAEPLTSHAGAGPSGASDAVRVVRRSWRDGVDQVQVTVPLAHGGSYVITRLAPAPAGAR